MSLGGGLVVAPVQSQSGTSRYDAYSTSGKNGTLVVVVGPEGVGKTNVCDPLAVRLETPRVSTGGLVRVAEDEGHPDHRYFRRALDADDLAALHNRQPGMRVPNRVVHKLFLARVSKPDCAKGFLVEGIRERFQSQWLEEVAARLNLTIRAIELHAPKDVLEGRITGRRTCTKCDIPYHLVSRPSAVQDVCDSCQGPLIQREEDTLTALHQRWAQTEPELTALRTYWDGHRCLKRVPAHDEVDVVCRLAYDVLTQGWIALPA